MRIITIIGILLIVLGILFLGPMLGLFTLKLMWPSVLLLFGIGFFLIYAKAPRITGFLMAGSVLAISSIPFFICTFSDDWSRMAILWPIFILSVSVGFFLMYFLGPKKNELIVSALVLLILGIVSFLIFNYIKFIFPIVFIVAGLILIFIGLVSRKKAKSVSTAYSPTITDSSVQPDDKAKKEEN